MKRNILFFIVLWMSCCCAMAQSTITLKFTGKNQNNDWIPLSRVLVEDQTQRWQEMLYYPDTTLFAGTVGIDDHAQDVPVQLFQNVPNPFNGVTNFSLQLNEAQKVQLEIYDVDGKMMAQYQDFLPQGVHVFRANLTTPQTYLLSARTQDGIVHIKMVNTGRGGKNSIEYVGADGAMAWKLEEGTKGASPYPFQKGDRMKYVGYATLNGDEFVSEPIDKVQSNSETIPLTFTLPLPVVTTSDVISVTGNGAVSGGNVTSDGGATVTARGVCWSTSQSPTVSNNHTSDGTGTGGFTSNITGLAAGTSYYVRAYATTVMGTAYGAQKSFVTLTIPTVTTAAVSSITSTTAVSGGNVTSDGGAMVTTKGVCWSTNPNPTLLDSHTTDNPGSGNFTSTITGLSAGTTYYVRAYATNSEGTAYGNQVSFTAANVPTVTTTAISSITSTTAVSGGNVTSDGGATVTARGVCWSTSQNPTVSDSHTTNGTGTGSFTSNMTGLSAGTTYYVRAYATNSSGTAYGNQVSFTTAASIPTVTTTAISSITLTTAVSGGNVTSDGGATVTARGVCWSTSQNPTVSDSHTTNGTGTGSFTSNMTGLSAGTTYYVRAYATNSSGTAYGNQVSFTTAAASSCGTVTDYDGNVYNTVQIGNQCWMKQNLKTTHYSNGTSISLGSTTSTTTAYRYYPGNSSSNVATYGYLYNWPAVMHGASSSTSNPSGVQGICPTGWHVPSDAEWAPLIDYVGSQSAYQCDGSSDKIAKALASTTGWSSSSNTCAVGNTPANNNATGFSAVPAGRYDSNGYGSFGDYAYFWSATQKYSNHAYYRYLYYNYANVRSYDNYQSYGCSVRCLRDESGSTVSIPTVTTTAISSITSTTAVSGGNVTSDGGATVTARGVCWSTSQNPTVSNSHTTGGTGTGSFTSNMTGLSAGTTYYVRAYATNSSGTAYGNQVIFTTAAASSCGTVTVTDYDGNVYNTVQIGNQCWMKQNLKTTHYSDGTSIALGSTTSETTAYRYYPNNSSSNVATYGYVYNWPAVMHGASSSSSNPSGVQGICPTGWHVPSDAEWTQLTDYVSSQNAYQCGSSSTNIAKALASTTGWISNTTTCAVGNTPSNNNATGFSAVPAGYSVSSGGYVDFGGLAIFCSATQRDSYNAYRRLLYWYDASVVSNYGQKSFGYSVRCLRD